MAQHAQQVSYVECATYHLDGICLIFTLEPSVMRGLVCGGCRPRHPGGAQIRSRSGHGQRFPGDSPWATLCLLVCLQFWGIVSHLRQNHAPLEVEVYSKCCSVCNTASTLTDNVQGICPTPCPRRHTSSPMSLAFRKGLLPCEVVSQRSCKSVARQWMWACTSTLTDL